MSFYIEALLNIAELTHTKSNNMKLIDWITTDPDNLQFMRKLGEDLYEFKEFERNMFNEQFRKLTAGTLNIKHYYGNDFWIREAIDLKQYTKEQAFNHVSAYYSESEFNAMWNQTGDWIDTGRAIIAECIFEQTNGLY